MRRRIATCTPLFFLLLLVLTTCGSNSNHNMDQQRGTNRNSYTNCPANPHTTAAAPESGTVTLTVSGWTSTPAEDALVQHDLHNFEATHPRIKLKWSPIPGGYLTKMRANVAGF